MKKKKTSFHIAGYFRELVRGTFQKMFSRYNFCEQKVIACVCILYHQSRKQNFYLCDELRPFVKMCVEKFERLEPVSIAKTLETFFLKM